MHTNPLKPQGQSWPIDPSDLMNCPFCDAPGFTEQGLKNHRCPGLRQPSQARNPLLTREQVAAAVECDRIQRGLRALRAAQREQLQEGLL